MKIPQLQDKHSTCKQTAFQPGGPGKAGATARIPPSPGPGHQEGLPCDLGAGGWLPGCVASLPRLHLGDRNERPSRPQHCPRAAHSPRTAGEVAERWVERQTRASSQQGSLSTLFTHVTSQGAGSRVHLALGNLHLTLSGGCWGPAGGGNVCGDVVETWKTPELRHEPRVLGLRRCVQDRDRAERVSASGQEAHPQALLGHVLAVAGCWGCGRAQLWPRCH